MPASPLESRMARLEGTYEQVSQRLISIDPRFDGIDRKVDLRFDALDQKLDLRFDALGKKIDALREALEKKTDALDAKVDQRFMWTVGIVVTTWATTIASIYLHH